MKPHRILDPDQFHENRVCCRFGIGEAIAAGAAFFGAEAAVDTGAAIGFGAEAAAGLGAGAIGAGAEGLGLGAGLAGETGLAAAAGGLDALGVSAAFSGLDFAGLGAGALEAAGLGGEAGLAGAGALGEAGAAIPTASALEAGAGAAGAGASAIPAAGAVTSPLAALDAGAATGVLDTGASGLGSGVLETAASTASADSLNPLNWTGFEAVDAASGAPVASGTFPTAAETAANAAAANPFTASAGEALPGLNAANDVIDTAAGGLSAPSTGALGSAASTGGSLAEGGSSLGTAAAGTNGSTSALGSIMSGLKTVAPLVPLASLGMTLAKGQPGLPPQEQQVEGAAGNLLATGQQNLTMAANQQITAPQTAEIETWKQQQMNALYQLYAKSGRDPNTDTDYLQGVQQINQQAIGMQQQFIDQLIKTGLGETGQATSALQAGAQMQIQQDEAFQKSISSAISAFGLTAGLSGLNVNLSKAA